MDHWFHVDAALYLPFSYLELMGIMFCSEPIYSLWTCPFCSVHFYTNSWVDLMLWSSCEGFISFQIILVFFHDSNFPGFMITLPRILISAIRSCFPCSLCIAALQSKFAAKSTWTCGNSVKPNCFFGRMSSGLVSQCFIALSFCLAVFSFTSLCWCLEC